MQCDCRMWKGRNLAELRISAPAGFENERAYAVRVVLHEWLGISYTLSLDVNVTDWIITDGIRTVTLPDVFFAMPNSAWLKPESLPKPPYKSLLIDGENLPMVFGRDENLAGVDESASFFGIDVFGSAFFWLTRYEEAVLTQRDPYGRFSVKTSTVGALVMRPIVNEYVEALWRALTRVFHGLTRKQREYRFLLSCDVDQPFGGAGRPLSNLARSMANDVRKRRPLSVAVNRLLVWARHDYAHDPCNTFDYLMAHAEKAAVPLAFYFIADHTGGRIDGDYAVDQPEIGKLMKQMVERGHEIGLHTSYMTSLDAAQTVKECAMLRQAMDQLGIDAPIRGGRQHYLRWEPSITWENWQSAGLHYDSTVGYFDSVGFRAGTCWEYPVYHLQKRQPINLIERPLVAMDATLWDDMGVRETDAEAGAALMLPILQACKKHRGDFTFLWHNHTLLFVQQRQLFERVLAAH